VIEFIVGVVLAAAAVWFVLQPILRPSLAASAAGDSGSLTEESEDGDDDFSPRAVALRALHEIEFDRATGKLSDEDYAALHQKYTAEALAAMRAEAGGKGTGEEGRVHRAPDGSGRTLPPSPLPLPACSAHGSRPEPGAIFCSECGRRLGSNPGYCARCGSGLETDARYCNTCGARVAA
jgi:hypothetical protein